VVIGIDFSIKSPAVCIATNDGNLSFQSFARNSVIKKDTELALSNAGVIVHVISDEPLLPKKSPIGDRERSSLIDAINQTNIIVNSLQVAKTVDLNKKEPGHLRNEWFFGIEGFSFGSTGNRLTQLSGYQWVLRYRLLADIDLQPDNFFVFAPMTVKATAGKGNFKKEQMIDAFLEADDQRLKQCSFWHALRDSPAEFQTRTGKWLKPIDDLVDSYWVLRTVENALI